MSSSSPSPAALRRRKSATPLPASSPAKESPSSPNSSGKGKGKGKAKGKNPDGLAVKLNGLESKLGEGLKELVVRLRPQGDGDYKVIAPGTPLDEVDLSEVDFLKHQGSNKKKKSKHQRGWRSWVSGRRFFFPLGIALGTVAAVVFLGGAAPSLPPEILDALNQADLGKSMQWPDVTRIWKEGFTFSSRDFQVGQTLSSSPHHLTKKHPVLLIPGIVSTGLESWSTDDASKSFFRKRLWGTTTMVQAVLSDKKRWLEALALDPVTGLDPKGHKVRAAQGLDAASEFIQGYWVWQKIVENLAALGYDTNAMDMASYDWRLAYYNLETRDAYFTRLKAKIEFYVRTNDQKAILVSHSMGATVVMYFLKWVEADSSLDIDGNEFGGDGGSKWVETYIDSWVNIAGTLLGVAKAETAFLSGEMKDTVEIGPAGAWVLEKAFSRKERAALFHSWPGSASMLLKGGNRIWGDHKSAPDDPVNATDTYGRFFSFRQTTAKGPNEVKTPKPQELTEETVTPNMTMNEAEPYVLMHTPNTFQRMVESNYSNSFETDVEKLKQNNKDHRKWSNPLEVQLPNAPSMKIFCLYGHGKPVERSYWYMRGDHEHGETQNEGDMDQSEADDLETNNQTRAPALNLPTTRKNWIDTSVEIKESIPQVKSGVVFGEGDGTVPLLSLGAMCVGGWKDKKWNPAGIEVITQEYKHEPEALDLRGGAHTGDHIDILGSAPLNEAVLRIAAGERDTIKEKLVSPIEKYVSRINWD